MTELSTQPPAVEVNAAYLSHETKRLRDLVENNLHRFKRGKAIQVALNNCYIIIVEDYGLQQSSAEEDENKNDNQTSLLCTACESGYVMEGTDRVPCKVCGGTGVKPAEPSEPSVDTTQELQTALETECKEKGYELRVHPPEFEELNFVVEVINERGLVSIEVIDTNLETALTDAKKQFGEIVFEDSDNGQKSFADQLGDGDRKMREDAGIAVPKKSEKKTTKRKSSLRNKK